MVDFDVSLSLVTLTTRCPFFFASFAIFRLTSLSISLIISLTEFWNIDNLMYKPEIYISDKYPPYPSPKCVFFNISGLFKLPAFLIITTVFKNMTGLTIPENNCNPNAPVQTPICPSPQTHPHLYNKTDLLVPGAGWY